MDSKLRRYRNRNYLVVFTSILIVIFMQIQAYKIDTQLQIISVVSLVYLIYSVLNWARITKDYLSLYSIFLIVFYLFNMGQSLLYLFNIPIEGFNTYVYLDIEYLLLAKIFTTVSILLFNTGAIYGFTIESSNKSQNELGMENSIFIVGVVLFLISVIPTLYFIYNVVQAQQSLGYRLAFESIYGKTGFSSAFSILSEFFVPSLFFIYIGAKQRLLKRVIIVIMFSYSLIYFYVGDRAYPISIILGIIWLRNRMKANRKANKLPIGLIFSILLLLLIIPVIGQLRNSSSITLSVILENITQGGLLEKISGTISTLGYSIFPLTKTMEIVPNVQDFSFGESYLYSLTSIIPNLGSGVHISVEKAGLSQWLMDQLGINYGPGFSITAEAFYNFGWFGMLLMIPFGYIYMKIVSRNDTKIQLAFAVIFFVLTITVTRREMMTLVRDVGYYLVIPYYTILFLSRNFRVIK